MVGEILKTTPCITKGCDGVMQITNTRPTRSKGIVKLFATCTSCGNHPMTSKKGQIILRKLLQDNSEDEYVQEVEEIDLEVTKNEGKEDDKTEDLSTNKKADEDGDADEKKGYFSKSKVFVGGAVVAIGVVIGVSAMKSKRATHPKLSTMQ